MSAKCLRPVCEVSLLGCAPKYYQDFHMSASTDDSSLRWTMAATPSLQHMGCPVLGERKGLSPEPQIWWLMVESPCVPNRIAGRNTAMSPHSRQIYANFYSQHSPSCLDISTCCRFWMTWDLASSPKKPKPCWRVVMFGPEFRIRHCDSRLTIRSFVTV